MQALHIHTAPAGPTTDQICASLAQAFESLWPQPGHIVAIVDPASHPAAWSRFGSLAETRGGGSLFKDTGQAEDKRVAPVVLPLREGDDDILLELVTIAKKSPAVVWAHASPTPRELAASLGRKLHGELADTGDAITLRYYDPRVLPALIGVLTDGQQVAFHEGVTAWWWLDRSHAVQRFSPPAGDRSGATSPPPVVDRGLQLTEEQVNRLLDASFVDRVLELVAKISPNTTALFDRVQLHGLAVRYIDAAARWNLRSEAECASYFAVALQEGPDFAETPPWPPLMDRVKRGELRFTAALQEWEAAQDDVEA